MLGIQTVTPPPNGTQYAASEADHDVAFEEGGSRIILQINTPLLIKGDNNIIALDPSLQASKIALSVVQALKQLSASSHGIPMVDEDGCPRPIVVEIKAEVKVEGNRNVVGEKSVMAGATSAAAAAATKRKQAGEGVKQAGEGVNGSTDIRKRERAGSDLGDGEAKRTKKE
jgi:hypothetical protein